MMLIWLDYTKILEKFHAFKKYMTSTFGLCLRVKFVLLLIFVAPDMTLIFARERLTKSLLKSIESIILPFKLK